MVWFGRDKTKMVEADKALPGRDSPLPVPELNHVNGHRIKPPSKAIFLPIAASRAKELPHER